MTLTLHRALFHSWDTVPIAPHSAPVPSVREQDPVPSARAARAQRPRRRPNEERRPRPLIVLIVHSVLLCLLLPQHPLAFSLACLPSQSPPHTPHTYRTHAARPPALAPTHVRTCPHISHLTSLVSHLTSYILHLTSYIVHRTSYILCNILDLGSLLAAQRVKRPRGARRRPAHSTPSSPP